MHTICARLSNQTNLPERRLAKLSRVGIGLHFKFLNGVDRWADRHVAELAGVVTGPIQCEVILIVTAADCDAGTEAAGGRADT